MRVETAGARTWLLAAVALWAVCVWVLAAVGLGGRVQPLPEDPALLQPLPQDDAAVGERLGPLPQYAEIGERPLFAADRRHHPFFIDPQGDDGDQPHDFDVVLASVLITPGLEMAIVLPRDGGEAMSFKVGESAREAPGWTLTSVEPRGATFAGPDGERRLELRVYDGIGGEPPTPVARPAQPDAAVAREEARAAGAGRQATRAPQSSQRPRQAAAAPEAAQTAADQAGNGAEDITPASQAEAIRRRIEARRAQLRQQQGATPQQQNP